MNGVSTTNGSIMKVKGSIKKDWISIPKKTKAVKTGTPVKSDNISLKSQKKNKVLTLSVPF
jgi:hypothetical protein